MKKIFATVLLILLLINISALPAYANSAHTSWQGVDTAGSVVLGEDCPIEVTKEVLTFNIAKTPVTEWHEITGFDVSQSTVTAEYTFYNPTDLEITASLAFPFVTYPVYGQETIDFDITLNEETIDKVVRYTLPSDSAFKLESDITRLSDEYISLGFFSPDMPVTKYTYKANISHLEQGTFRAITVSGDNDASRIYFPSATRRRSLENGDVIIGNRAAYSDTVEIYVIGEPLEEPPKWTLYTDKTLKEGVNTSDEQWMELVSTGTYTFELFALADRMPHSKVSDVDWYNAVIYALEYRDDYGVLASRGLQLENELMHWYQYEITIAPGESVINTVTAPMYPDVETYKDPAYFEYTYLLSPASKWANFGELEININTPYYIIDSNIEGFVKTENCYTLTINGLPNTELEFTLRSTPKLVREIKSSTKLLASIPDEYFYAGTALAVTLVCVVIFIKIRKG